MIVPRYWAEGRAQHLADSRQITARRYGWSDTSVAAAQAMADTRARETLALLVAGEPVPRRDPEHPYHGTDGVPIREEIVRQDGPTILTRNGYGALCLNTPDVLFADVDFRPLPSPARSRTGPVFVAFAALSLAWLLFPGLRHLPASLLIFFAAFSLGSWVVNRQQGIAQRRQPGPEEAALAAVRRFAAAHPDWSLRLYRTPRGLRVLATHRTYLPDDPAVTGCFDALRADPTYVRMCSHQRCFRARVSPKPWRIGVREHVQPRRAAWPVAPENLPARAEWVTRYETAAQGFASCRLLETLGPGIIHPDVQPVQELHDALCRATSTLPIA